MDRTESLPALFTCERLRARMTEAGCARMFISARERTPYPDEARSACVGCELGARHAGVDIERAREAQRAAELVDFCSECGRSGRRMIGRVICVSCYNRRREAMCGRDARGRVPKFIGRYHPVSLAVTLPGLAATGRNFALVAGRAQAIMIAAQQAKGVAIAIGFQRLSPLPPGALLELSPAFAPVPPPPPSGTKHLRYFRRLMRFQGELPLAG